MQRTRRSGSIEEKYNFYASETKPRAPRSKASTQRMKDSNEREAEKRVARLLNCNFSHNDLMLTLTYREDTRPDAREAMEKDLTRFLGRMKYHLGKAGVKLRYIAVTATVNGDTGELVKGHHHIVLGAEGTRLEGRTLWAGKADVQKLWGKGSVNVAPVHDQDDLTPIARYLLRQVPRVQDKSAYKASRNLKKPELIDERITRNVRELQPPKGAKLLYRAEWEPGKGQYIRYVMPERRLRKKVQKE